MTQKGYYPLTEVILYSILFGRTPTRAIFI